MTRRSTLKRNLHGHVVRELGLRVVCGDYRPGDNLPNHDFLAAEMNVSSGAIREAIKALVAKGLVESRAKVGTRVRPREFWNSLDPDVLEWRCSTMPTGDFVRNLMEMREIIEPAAAGLAAVNRSKTQLEDIERAYHAMAQSKDVDEYAIADLHFHQAVLRATDNALLVPLSHVIATALETFFLMAARKSKEFNYSLPQHLAVVKAIQARKAETARRAMLRILLDTRNLRSAAR
ncbi:MAG TPA: FadR/GntR family transcriptional regulator [Steroidobacteraceae bacterium]|nr:FadR/GntR family transcriptional regulator [Steroidobacteraceae bacterium]